VDLFTKLREPINQGTRPLNLGGRKRLTWRPLHTLTSKTMSQIFGTCVCYYFKVRKGKKIGLSTTKRHNFLMKRMIRIRRHGFVGDRSDNILFEFQPIWSRGCLPGSRNAHTTCLFFTLKKQRKNKIRRLSGAMRLSHQERHRRGTNFLFNNRTVTVNTEQVQISTTARGNLFTSE